MESHTLVGMRIRFTSFLLLLIVNGCGQGPAEGLPGKPLSPQEPEALGTVPNADWSSWRGPNHNGIAVPQDIVSEWGADKNILWRTELPGKGHSSPIVVGKQVFISTAEAGKYQALMAFDRTSGEAQWKTDLHTTGVQGKIHERNSYATSTPAYHDGAVYLPFYNAEKIVMSKVDTEGRIIWQKPIMDFASLWGFSVSPTIYKDLVLLSIEHLARGAIVALKQDSGDIAWKTARSKGPNHASPVLLKLNGTDQFVINGAKTISSYHPETGAELWSTPATTVECVGSVVALGDLVFGSGGYPDHITSCVSASQPGTAIWTVKKKVYAPSMLAVNDHLYAVSDRGIAYCWEARTGKEKWVARLKGDFSTSLVLVKDRLLAVSEQGTAYIFEARSDKFNLRARNQLGNDTFATPSVCGGRIYLRTAQRGGGKRQETLYCIGR